MDIKDQIKRVVSILDVASMYVNLKPAGKNFKALCPFHSEKTPSFFVMPDKNTYNCFGCNKFGDIFTLVQEMENLNFPEAMNFLIDRFQIPVERPEYRTNQKKDLYEKINEIANTLFRENLNKTAEGEKARAYLRQRGIKDDTIDLFSLGYAENKWDGLCARLKELNCDQKKAIELGLLVKNENNRIYDRFRGRLIFPIFSESGKILAFGGRTLFDENPKYLNSPDTPLFKKGKNLFGFHIVKQDIRDHKQAILVEGYFDMISLFQNGVRNAVATLGTALTEDQINLVKRFSDEIYIFYDTDDAGSKATLRGIEKMFEQNINPFIINAGTAKDPDDFIREQGQHAFVSLKKNAVSGFKYLLDKVSQRVNLEIPEKKKIAIEEIKRFLIRIEDSVVREGYRMLAADFFKVSPQMIELEKASSGITVQSSGPLMIRTDEKEFIESILLAPEFIKDIKELFNVDLMSVLKSKNIIQAIFRNYSEDSNEIDLQLVAREINDAEKARFNIIYMANQEESKKDRKRIAKRIESSFLSFQNSLNEKKIFELNQKIRIAERDGNEEKVNQLMNLKNRFIREKRKLSGGKSVERTQG
jgi:DNA primase